jgi:nucleoside-diphosphate-sugar epimerase
MRVLVTGATGFVGAYSSKALADAGHDVRVLVRDPARISSTVGNLGVEIRDHVVGDMTDAEAVARAVRGCDAVLHCAAVVSLKRERANEVRTANPLGARVVMDAALEQGLDPVVIVSSASALDATDSSVLKPDGPVRIGGGAYAASKAETAELVRRYQADGAPITVTFPGGVVGPAVSGSFGEAGEAVAANMKMGALPVATASLPFIDARDVGLVHAALMQKHRGPRSYLCGGHTVTTEELADCYRRVTGRRFPVLPVPASAMRFTGKALDALARVVPFDSIITEEAMIQYTTWRGSDDSRVVEELGISWRPLDVTLADTVRSLYVEGRITARQAGRIATSNEG